MAVVVVNSSITAEYFKKHMTNLELKYVIKQINNKYQNEWEQVRWLGYVNMKGLTGQPESPKDLMLFSWENIDSIDNELEKEAINDLSNRANNALMNFDRIKDKFKNSQIVKDI